VLQKASDAGFSRVRAIGLMMVGEPIITVI
jgi:hypothetical protein